MQPLLTFEAELDVKRWWKRSTRAGVRLAESQKGNVERLCGCDGSEVRAELIRRQPLWSEPDGTESRG